MCYTICLYVLLSKNVPGSVPPAIFGELRTAAPVPRLCLEEFSSGKMMLTNTPAHRAHPAVVHPTRNQAESSETQRLILHSAWLLSVSTLTCTPAHTSLSAYRQMTSRRAIKNTLNASGIPLNKYCQGCHGVRKELLHQSTGCAAPRNIGDLSGSYTSLTTIRRRFGMRGSLRLVWATAGNQLPSSDAICLAREP